jgi:7-keto-8-aminopelargonate synthetase-like enzyme
VNFTWNIEHPYLEQAEDPFLAVDAAAREGIRAGLTQVTAEDEQLEGRIITVEGKEMINFGSCSYLGLEMHPRLRMGVIDAVTRYGSQFSSSRAFLSAPAYAQAEGSLSELFGRPSLLTPSTTLGHIAALPALLGRNDALVLDAQVHNSVQTAAQLARAREGGFFRVPHNRMERLDRLVAKLAKTHNRVWFATDGLFSMYADFFPVTQLNALMERHSTLWLYIDDAHSISWTGRHGRGYALEHLSATASMRSVVAGSLNKSFAASGGVLTFPNADMLHRVFNVGGPMIFSGPVQPPMIGAVIASASLHLSGSIVVRQERLMRLIRLFNSLAAEHGLPLAGMSEAPIRYVTVGDIEATGVLTRMLRDRGYFADPAAYPAVPKNRSGIRITLTCHHTEEDIRALVDTMAELLPNVLKNADQSIEQVKRLCA